MKKIEVYKCDLLSITPNIKVENDQSKKHNIKSAQKEKKKTIIVKPTIFRNYFKEILTGIKIPIYRIQKIKGYEELEYHYPPKTPCYIQYTEEIDGEEYLGNTLQEATLEEIKAYLDRYSSETDIEQLRKEITSCFFEAEEYYKKAQGKKNVSESAEIKKLIKKKK